MRNDTAAIWMPREAWANLNLPRRGRIVAPEMRTEVFIHHTATVDADDTPSVWESYDEIRDHMHKLQTIRPDLGIDVPYSVVCFILNGLDHPRLVIAEGRGLYRSGAHSRGHNTSALGISFAGNFEESDPWQLKHLLGGFGTERPLSNWLNDLRRHLGFSRLMKSQPPVDTDLPAEHRDRPTGRRVWCHSDIKATACPGRHLRGKLWMI